MILGILSFLLIIILLCFIFCGSNIVRDVKTDFQKKTTPPSRTPINLRKSAPTAQYEFNNAEAKIFSQPKDGKMDQYDFNLPSLPHHPSMYFSSNAFLAKKRIKKNMPVHHPLYDASIVENHRYYYNDRQSQILSRNKRKSDNIPSNQDIYNSSSQFHNNALPTSYEQILSSAKNPHVLPAIIKKKAKSSPSLSSTPSFSTNQQSTSSPSLSSSLPPPPPSAATGISGFNFNFGST